MPTQLQLRRGTTAQTAIFVGALAEVTVDTDKKTLVVHDGITQGGFSLPVDVDVSIARDIANSSFIQANSGFETANSANTLAQQAFDQANVSLTNSFVLSIALG